MSELLKCPFCGGEAKVINYGFNQYSVNCSECWLETRRTSGINSAIKAWNARTPMDRILERLEVLADEANDKIFDDITHDFLYHDGLEDGFRDAIKIIKEEGGIC